MPAGDSATRSPRVSVVMGVYNGGERLVETVRSIRAQTLQDWELILVDDGSTDPDHVRRATACEADDPRIRIVRTPRAGLTRALIRGCESSTATYIARIDVGDVMLPDRLERQVDALDRWPEVVLTSCWTEVCGPQWEPLYEVRGRPTPDGGARVVPEAIGPNLLNGPTHHGSVAFRRLAYQAAGGYRAAFYYGQDWDLWYRMLANARLYIVPAALYRCRLLPDGISARQRRRQERIGRCSLDAFNRRRRGEDDAPSLARAARVRPRLVADAPAKPSAEGLYLVGALLWRRRDARCRAYFMRAMKCNPFYWRSYLGWWRSRRLAAAGKQDP